jgi:AraC-like DNA-binding protein
LSALAHALGYADQSHLAREVRRLSGSTPSELRRSLQGPSETTNDSDVSGVDVGFVQDQARLS